MPTHLYMTNEGGFYKSWFPQSNSIASNFKLASKHICSWISFTSMEGCGGGTKDVRIYWSNTMHSNIGGGTSHPHKVDMYDKLDLVVQPHILIKEYNGTLYLNRCEWDSFILWYVLWQINKNLHLSKNKYSSNLLQLFFLFNALVENYAQIFLRYLGFRVHGFGFGSFWHRFLLVMVDIRIGIYQGVDESFIIFSPISMLLIIWYIVGW